MADVVTKPQTLTPIEVGEHQTTGSAPIVDMRTGAASPYKTPDTASQHLPNITLDVVGAPKSDTGAIAAAAAVVGTAAIAGSELAKPKDQSSGAGDQQVKQIDLHGMKDEPALRDKIREALKEAKEGKPINFKIDMTKAVVDAAGKPIAKTRKDGAGNPIEGTQADILYEELQKAYPDNHFVFRKPDVQPGEAGYKEFPAAVVNADGTHESTRENQITLGQDVEFGGATIPKGSKLSLGALFEPDATKPGGGTIRNASASDPVVATTPDGKEIKIAGAGETVPFPGDSIDKDPLKRGQINDKGDYVMVRASDDMFPIPAAKIGDSYHQGTKDGLWAPNAVQRDHFKLENDMTMAVTRTGGSADTVDGAGNFFMRSGYKNDADAAAKNYTGVPKLPSGELDVRSAQEMMRLRTELGLTDQTQVGSALEEYILTTARSNAAGQPVSDYRYLEDAANAARSDGDPTLAGKIDQLAIRAESAQKGWGLFEAAPAARAATSDGATASSLLGEPDTTPGSARPVADLSGFAAGLQLPDRRFPLAALADNPAAAELAERLSSLSLADRQRIVNRAMNRAQARRAHIMHGLVVASDPGVSEIAPSKLFADSFIDEAEKALLAFKGE